jgi:hypothetical protein
MVLRAELESMVVVRLDQTRLLVLVTAAAVAETQGQESVETEAMEHSLAVAAEAAARPGLALKVATVEQAAQVA